MTKTQNFSPVFTELPHIVPVFVEFDCTKGSVKEKDWFIGESLEAILADTNGGRSFGMYEYTGYRVVTEDYIRSLKLDYVDSGLNSVKAGRVGPLQGFNLSRTPNGRESIP